MHELFIGYLYMASNETKINPTPTVWLSTYFSSHTVQIHTVVKFTLPDKTKQEGGRYLITQQISYNKSNKKTIHTCTDIENLWFQLSLLMFTLIIIAVSTDQTNQRETCNLGLYNANMTKDFQNKKKGISWFQFKIKSIL